MLGAAFPSILIITLIAMVFDDLAQLTLVENIFMAVRPAVVALIVYSVIKLAKSAKIKEYYNWVLTLMAVIFITVFNVHPIIVIIVAACYGIFLRGRVVRIVDSRKAGKEVK